MKAKTIALLMCLITCPAAVCASDSPATDNPALAALFAQDQADRNQSDIDWQALSQRDAERRTQLKRMLQQGQLRTANDYRHAAFIQQHGDTPEDYRLAHALATLAMTLEDSAQNRWIVAASWDRLLMSHTEPQWYGTQMRGDADGMYLFPVNPTALDESRRKHMSGHSLAEHRQKLETMAKQIGQKLRDPAPTIEQLRARQHDESEN
ncbi:hypothetical protein CO610_00625 [Lysobacteraceae bacterium NML95-0200]|nr:hypothetical protein CO610_00625 [Xanthomonadaceae bacterium NML95-0200]